MNSQMDQSHGSSQMEAVIWSRNRNLTCAALCKHELQGAHLYGLAPGELEGSSREVGSCKGDGDDGRHERCVI